MSKRKTIEELQRPKAIFKSAMSVGRYIYSHTSSSEEALFVACSQLSQDFACGLITYTTFSKMVWLLTDHFRYDRSSFPLTLN